MKLFEVVQGQGGGTRVVSREFADTASAGDKLCGRTGNLVDVLLVIFAFFAVN